MSNAPVSAGRMILLPGLVTLAVTLLRLVGEIQNWSPLLFNKSPGGFGAIVGITWLALIFAVIFALRLQAAGDTPANLRKAFLICAGALVLTIAGNAMAIRSDAPANVPVQAAGILVVTGALALARYAWPTYWGVLLAYALAARIPVIVVMLLAIRGDWGTHYDVALPNTSFGNWWIKFVQIGLIPQASLWIPFTVIFCGIFGIAAVALRKRRPGHPTAN